MEKTGLIHRTQQRGPLGSEPLGGFWRMALIAALIGWLAAPGSAQFLRLGIFDLAGNANVDLIYTTNVEGERKSQAKDKMEDYYLVPSLTLSGRAPFGRTTQLTLDTSFGMEKHFIRTDLDSESAPFGRLRLDTRTELGRYVLSLYGGFERALEERESRYVPGNRKRRDPTDTWEYGVGVNWDWRRLRLIGTYETTLERHLNAEFMDGDKNDVSMMFNASVMLREGLSATYSYERNRTELINDPADVPEWETTETISLDWTLPLLKRPTLTYSLGVERETQNGKVGDWELTHTISLTGDWEVFPAAGALRLSLKAAYQYEKDPEEDDISFTYGANLEHDISSTARQQLILTREPVETFGSKNETDRTQINYSFVKREFLLYNLNFNFNAGWSRDVPMVEGSQVEVTKTYSVGLTHSQALSRKLDRQLAYLYTVEDSSLEAELLQEHRVTLSFKYTF